MNWQLIESDEALDAMLQRAAGSDVVMVDTEFMRRNTFYPEVALLQLCFRGGDADGTAWLVDPLKIQNTAGIVSLLTNPSVVKVLHSGSEDLEVFQHWLGILPLPLFDTQRAAAMVGLDFGLGYRSMVLELCEVDLPKGETQSDWLQRPLTESQCEYAAQDVTWLLDAYTQIATRCDAQSKTTWVLEDGVVATASLATTATDYYKRVKGAWKLPPQQLAVLIAVCDWREAKARERNKPRSWIIDDKACLQLAEHRPADWRALKATTELPAPAQRRYGDELLELIGAVQKPPVAALPEALPAPLDAGQRNVLKKLKQTAAAIAKELGVAPQVLLQSKDYEILLRGEQVSGYWSGWRQALVIAPLQSKLKEING